MAVLTIRMPENKAERLKALAAQRGISVNKLVEELATFAIAEFDVEARFRLRAARGSAERGKRALAELDAYYASGPGGGAPSPYDFHDSATGKYEGEPPKK